MAYKVSNKKKEKEKVNSEQRNVSENGCLSFFFCGRQRGVIRGNLAREIKAICPLPFFGFVVQRREWMTMRDKNRREDKEKKDCRRFGRSICYAI